MNIFKIIEEDTEYYIDFDFVGQIVLRKSINEIKIIFKNNMPIIVLKPSNKQAFKELSEALVKKFNDGVDISTIKTIEVL